jgi:hypothetical protein
MTRSKIQLESLSKDYEVEKVLDKKTIDGKIYYLLKWRFYSQ